MIAALCAAGMGTTDVIRMEGLVANGADAIQRGGDVCVPRIYGEIYAYKPPLAYWLAAGSRWVLGAWNGWVLRLPFALCALLLGLVVDRCVAPIAGHRAGLIAGLASVTGVQFASKIGMAGFDVPLALGLGIATAAAARNLVRQEATLGLWIACYAGLAFGFLAKGPIALGMYAPGLWLAAMLTGELRRLFTVRHAAGMLAWVMPVGAWAWCAYRQAGPDAFAQAGNEAGLRVFDWRLDTVLLAPVKPLLALVLFLPWSLFVPGALRGLGTRATERERLLRAAAGFFGGGLVLLCAVATLEPRYFLPLAAPLGILAGLQADRLPDVSAPRLERILRGALVLCALALLVGALQNRAPLALWLRVGLGLCAFGTAVTALPAALPWHHLGGPLLGRCCGLALALAIVQIGYLRPYKAASRSGRALAQAVASTLPKDAEIWTDSVDAWSSFFFYLGHPVRSFAGQPALPMGSWVWLPVDTQRESPVQGDLLGTFTDHGKSFQLLLSR